MKHSAEEPHNCSPELQGFIIVFTFRGMASETQRHLLLSSIHDYPAHVHSLCLFLFISILYMPIPFMSMLSTIPIHIHSTHVQVTPKKIHLHPELSGLLENPVAAPLMCWDVDNPTGDSNIYFG